MKSHRLGLFAALALGAAACFAAASHAAAPEETPGFLKPARAALDKPVKEFTLRDVMHDLKPDEKEADADISLARFKGKKNVVLFFMSEKCSVTWRYEKRVGQMLKDYAKKDVVFLGVRSSANDTPESIRKFAEAKNFAMPVLDDVANRMADYYKVQVTPTFVVIDKKGVMRYFGSFDDSPEEPEVKSRFLPDAVQAVLANRVVSTKETEPFG